MGKTTDEIATDIDRTREHLMSNLQELETRVKDVADWRTYVRKRPTAMVVAALLGGVLLSTVLGKGRAPPA